MIQWTNAIHPTHCRSCKFLPCGLGLIRTWKTLQDIIDDEVFQILDVHESGGCWITNCLTFLSEREAWHNWCYHIMFSMSFSENFQSSTLNNLHTSKLWIGSCKTTCYFVICHALTHSQTNWKPPIFSAKSRKVVHLWRAWGPLHTQDRRPMTTAI